MNKQRIAILSLVGFIIYTGVYIFVYLWRSFRVDEPANLQYVAVWHGDNFSRAILVSILFLIGLVVTLHLSQLRREGNAGSIALRSDIREWLIFQADETNDDPSRLADRIIGTHRALIEGSRTG
ncbi:MAG: hypothetical protein V3S62_09305 [Acidimicrobiia bacterium]